MQYLAIFASSSEGKQTSNISPWTVLTMQQAGDFQWKLSLKMEFDTWFEYIFSIKRVLCSTYAEAVIINTVVIWLVLNSEHKITNMLP